MISPLDNGAASTYNWELLSACGMINDRDMMLFFVMIDGGDTTLFLVGVGGLIDGRDTTLLLLAG